MKRIIYCRSTVKLFLLICCGLLPSIVVADENHYNELFIGGRATGLGGAYTAIADDTAGLFYNPAGIVHAAGSNISGSMNALNNSNKTYKNALGANTDWTRTSSELSPNFFGILQDFADGKAGFSYAVVDSALENQDEVFTNISLQGAYRKEFVINFNNQDRTIVVGPSYAIEYNDKLSLGVTLYGHYRQLERIMHFFVDFDGAGDFRDVSQYVSNEEIGIQPTFGLMYSPRPRISLGLTMSRTFVLSSETRVQVTESEKSPDTNNLIISNRRDTVSDFERDLPLTLRFGAAYFADKTLLYSADLAYYSAVNNREAVVNLSFGSEYYFNPRWAMRAGFYTNNANTPNLRSQGLADGTEQLEHVDYRGFTLSLTRFTRSNALTLGVQFANGDGLAQLFSTQGGVTDLQNVEANSFNLFMSASYSY